MKKLFLLSLIATSIFANDNEVSLSFLQTTDIHGHYLKGRTQKTGGLLRLASIIRKLKKDNPNHLLIDCGDTIQGSPMATLGRGEIAVKLLNQLKYDAWILGNHELDFGLKRLDELVNVTKVPIIAGNFSFNKRKFPAWKIYNKQGVKIALIGLQVGYLRHWFIGKDYSNYKIEKGYNIVKKSLQELRNHHPDIIILAAHQGCIPYDWRGVNEIQKICEDFPEINIAFGGHTHQDIFGKVINKTYYVQAGYHSENIAVVKLIYDKNKRKIISLNSYFKQATEYVKYDKKIYKMISLKLEKNKKKLNQILFHLSKKKSKKEMDQITSQAILKLTEADFSLQRPIRFGLPKGDIKLENLFKLYPYENRLFSIEVTAKELKSIMLEQKKSRNGRGQKLWSKNIRKIEKLKSILFYGKRRIVVNSYTAAGAGRYPQLVKIINNPSSKLKEYQDVIRNVIQNFLAKE